MNIFRNYINNRQLGYLFVLIAVLLYSISDAIMKHYTNVYPVSEVTFLRTVARFCPYIILVLFKKINPLKSERKTVNILRAILASIGTYSFMTAYSYSAMTDVFVVGSTTAIFVIPFSVFFLKEKFSAQNLIAIFLGFSGICLAFRPGYGIFQIGILFAVLGAVIAALNQVLIKKLATTESEFTIIFYHNICVMVIMSLIGWHDFISLNFNDLMFLIVGGLIGAVAQYCMIHAFKLSSSSGLASAGYIMIVPNVLFDIFLFHKIPDVYILFGTLLTLSGLYMAFRLQRKFK